MSVWPAWEVREEAGATAWFGVRLAFPDGALVEALAVVAGGCVSVEDVRARPALSLDDLTVLADWIEDPLFDACGLGPAPTAEEATGSGRARPPWPRGIEGRRLVAEEYRAAQEDGADPVLAVMCATGHSRRKSLRMIAQARDAGYLTPRHARR
ncbi:hypothetical protein SLINC_1182 [Streptomyces lincolnensis]|uniref:Uncharacterized protein n=1 Tax=Streptomyces lincolnensis TaxID=1915 RepID=A0A1B1M423_STRLN|nr:DUF6214 family protein [Streptomyces lincolnensis]ANS63406.1 hypothetical protein SLINC_1182 [Streptomyces lincolnensis]AXG52328.1 hypothetical protein SLCG_1173 [Streptomyces lincolnensis]QMV05299.1 hypothetical protein GJU35_06275 [Streptomyces lincolnensis]